MKTSTLIATIAIAGSFITVTAANLKLKSEYDRHNLKDAFVNTEVPSFRFIKDLTDSNSLHTGVFEIRAGKKETPGVAKYYSQEKVFVFRVVNDTLYIETDKNSS